MITQQWCVRFQSKRHLILNCWDHTQSSNCWPVLFQSLSQLVGLCIIYIYSTVGFHSQSWLNWSSYTNKKADRRIFICVDKYIYNPNNNNNKSHWSVFKVVMQPTVAQRARQRQRNKGVREKQRERERGRDRDRERERDRERVVKQYPSSHWWVKSRDVTSPRPSIWRCRVLGKGGEGVRGGRGARGWGGMARIKPYLWKLCLRWLPIHSDRFVHHWLVYSPGTTN